MAAHPYYISARGRGLAETAAPARQELQGTSPCVLGAPPGPACSAWPASVGCGRSEISVLAASFLFLTRLLTLTHLGSGPASRHVPSLAPPASPAPSEAMAGGRARSASAAAAWVTDPRACHLGSQPFPPRVRPAGRVSLNRGTQPLFSSISFYLFPTETTVILPI